MMIMMIFEMILMSRYHSDDHDNEDLSHTGCRKRERLGRNGNFIHWVKIISITA